MITRILIGGPVITVLANHAAISLPAELRQTTSSGSENSANLFRKVSGSIFFDSMAGGGEKVDESQFKGMAKYFNSITDKGRANKKTEDKFYVLQKKMQLEFSDRLTAKATYLGVGLIIAFFMLKPKRQVVTDAAKPK
uniref:Uncharacterized protein n=1 Tax=Strigamia maritima TaxID=126957 RepID=T1JIU1_STRMM